MTPDGSTTMFSTTAKTRTARALSVLCAVPVSIALMSGAASAAEVQDAYAPSNTGAASANGGGVGKAVGKPAAGTVGKADSKTPKGQLPGGSDGNNGYECDGNSGIARTNPAHTSGCGWVYDLS